jgi:O-antigen ligase
VGSRVVDLFTLSQRVETVIAGRDASVQQRQTITVITLGIIRENFLIGVGFGAFEKTFDFYREGYLSTKPTGSAHNTFLRTLGETGIVGFIPFVVFVGYFIRRLWRAFKRNAEHDERVLILAVLFSISTFWLMSLTLDQLFEPHFWVVAGIGMSLVSGNKDAMSKEKLRASSIEL